MNKSVTQTFRSSNPDSRIIISGGTVIDPETSVNAPRDILIEAGKIRALDKPGAFYELIKETNPRVLDATGCLVVPGLIDMHVHLREPGFEWKETIQTGSEAAALGGFTSICCMPNTKPVNDSAEITRFIIERASNASARVFPIGAVSMGLKGEQMAPLSELHKAGCVAFSDDGEPVWSAGLMRRALEWCAMFGSPICCHEEDKSLTCGGCVHESARSLKLGLKGMPGVAEDVMVARDIELARATGAHVHICHVSTARSVELIRRAKNDGFRVTAEVTPHHLALTEEAVGDYDTNAKMSPPLREVADREALRVGLREGVIDVVASDHAPHDLDTKRCEFSRASFGILGLQTAVPVIFNLVESGILPLQRAISAMSTASARILSLPYGRLSGAGLSGTTANVESIADIAVLDPNREVLFAPAALKSLSKNTPWLNQSLKGSARHVITGGRVTVSEFMLEEITKSDQSKND